MSLGSQPYLLSYLFPVNKCVEASLHSLFSRCENTWHWISKLLVPFVPHKVAWLKFHMQCKTDSFTLPSTMCPDKTCAKRMIFLPVHPKRLFHSAFQSLFLESSLRGDAITEKVIAYQLCSVPSRILHHMMWQAARCLCLLIEQPSYILREVSPIASPIFLHITG